MADADEEATEGDEPPLDPRDVPVAAFRASCVAQPGHLCPAREATRRLGSAMWDDVLDDTPLDEVEGIVLHAYMTRRFGPPNLPGDRRMISAVWLLDTPDPGVFVEVGPRLCQGGRNFLPRILSEAEHPRIDDARAAEVADAYRATLVDLLRPVRVGDDGWLNALGECERYDPAFGGDGEGEVENPLLVEPHGSCGNATPTGSCDTPRWGEFWTAVRHLGKGDYLAGQDRVVSTARGQAVAEIPHADEAVRVLVLAHIHGDYAKTVIRMADPAGTLRDEAVAVRLALEEAWRRGEHLPIRAFTDDEVERARDYLAVLGCRTPIMNALERHRRRAAQEAFAERFLALGDFPAEAVPASILPTYGEAHGLADLLRGLGRHAQADLVAASLAADPEGGGVYRVLARGYEQSPAGRARYGGDGQPGPGATP